MQVAIIESDDWQGIYLDGYLHDEAHQLGDGDHFYYLINLADKYGFSYKEITQYSTNDKGNEYLLKYGRFPLELSDFEGMYALY